MASGGVDIARSVLGIIGNVTSLVLFASPAFTFRDIVSSGSAEHHSPNPYLAALFNCIIWVLYALPIVHPNSWPVLIINGIGVVIEAFYLALYIYYSTEEVRHKVFFMLAGEVVLAGFVAAVVLSLAQSQERRSLCFGILGVISGIAMYAAPLSTMRTVFRTDSVEHMSLALSAASLANAVFWTIYAVIGSFDVYVFVPNMMGVICAGAQLCVYACYFSYDDLRITDLA